MAKTVTDLMALLGWDRRTVLSALHRGHLPGYQAVPHGHWAIPDDAFHQVAAGTWRPPAAPVVRVVRPIRKRTPAPPVEPFAE